MRVIYKYIIPRDFIKAAWESREFFTKQNEAGGSEPIKGELMNAFLWL